MARKGFLSWLTGGAIESVRDIPVVGWIAEKVAPTETPKDVQKGTGKTTPKGSGVRRKTVSPKPRLTTGSPGTGQGNAPGTPNTGGSPVSGGGTKRPLSGMTARDLQIQFSNPFATRSEREKAVRQWLKIHPRPGEAHLTPNEMSAFREAYSLTESEKW